MNNFSCLRTRKSVLKKKKKDLVISSQPCPGLREESFLSRTPEIWLPAARVLAGVQVSFIS